LSEFVCNFIETLFIFSPIKADENGEKPAGNKQKALIFDF
jgi:hypothetical protein